MTIDTTTRRIGLGLCALAAPALALASGEQAMSTIETNKRVLLDFIETVWRRGDLDALPRFWTEDCLNHAAPLGGQKGLASLRAYHEGFRAAFGAFSDARIEILQQVAEGDRVSTQMITRARRTGAFMGAPATGRDVALATIRIDRLAAGRIAEHWSVADMAGLMSQIQA